VVLGNASEAGREKVQSLTLLELPFSLVSITYPYANDTLKDMDLIDAISERIERSTVKARSIFMVCRHSAKSVVFDSDGWAHIFKKRRRQRLTIKRKWEDISA
jgi:hypothetical protein